jgi:hypothetical protein
VAERSSPRFFLADLVAAVLLCGVIAAFLASGRSLDKSPYVPIGALVFATWFFLRSRRTAPTCDMCGQRFIPPKPSESPIDCPHCGARLEALARTLKQREFEFRAMGFLLMFSVVAAITFATDASIKGKRLGGDRSIAVAIASGIAVLSGLAMAGIGASRSRLVRPQDRSCEACGATIPERPPGPTVCPNCLGRHQDRERAEKEQAEGRKLIRIVGMGLALGIVFSLVMVGVPIVRKGDWTGLPAFLLVVLVAVLLGGLLLRFWSRSQKVTGLMREEETLARARRCAGEEGMVVQEGPATVWYSGRSDPVPELREEIAGAHCRFEALLGETDIPDPPIRILCFHERDALLRFYEASFPGVDLAAQVGLYLQRPWCLLLLCTAEVPGRISDPRLRAGSLYVVVLLEQVYGSLPGPWVQAGLTKGLDAHGGRGDLARLNRRMVAALSGGAAWSEDLFSTSAHQVSKLFQRSKDPRSARKAELFTDQAWSIIEYLGGESAPEARRAAFRAFLKDKRAKSQQESAFFQHIGFGFGTLLDDWRSWVLDRGIGADEAPPPELRDALVNRVLPVVRDRHARGEDRIQAIRDWRSAGVVLGADALIDLLRDPGDIPKEEVVWALCMASGMAWGDEPDRWQDWWDGLPRTSDRSAELATTSSDARESTTGFGPSLGGRPGPWRLQ